MHAAFARVRSRIPGFVFVTAVLTIPVDTILDLAHVKLAKCFIDATVAVCDRTNRPVLNTWPAVVFARLFEIVGQVLPLARSCLAFIDARLANRFKDPQAGRLTKVPQELVCYGGGWSKVSAGVAWPPLGDLRRR